MGTRCNSTNQACGVGQGPIVCGMGTVPQCLSFCRPEHIESVAPGAACVLDPCAPTATWTPGPGMAAIGVCPPEFFCDNNRHPDYPTRLGVGRCVRTVARGARACDPEDQTCETGTYCRAFNGVAPGGGLSACSGLARPKHILASTGFNGMCVLPVREGGACDSNIGQLGCLQCEAGTTCNIDDVTGLRICQRPCDDNSDCSCAPNSTLGLTCGTDRLCNVCISNGNQCTQNGPFGCCDPLATCAPADPAVAPGVVCARPTGSPCTLSTQCAPGDLCVGGTCASCGGLREPPDPLRGCCSPDLEVRGNRCVARCTQTGPCTSPGCNQPNTNYVCTDFGSECPVPNNNTDTLCDGLDFDCNGVADEDFPTNQPCGALPSTLPAICPGWTGSGGRLSCESGVSICKAREGVDVCWRTPLSNSSGGTDCFGLGDVCGSDSQCRGGEICASVGSGPLRCVINPACPDTLCWAPNTLGGACP